jgi:type I restriction enzyme S subunit
LDCPDGTFLGTGEKTAVLFFEKGTPTRTIWYYQLDPGRSLGKTNPLNDPDLAEFIELHKTFVDSKKSWSVDATNIDTSTFSLSVTNPNGSEAVVHRCPQAIMDEITALDVESQKVLHQMQKASRVRNTPNGAQWQEKRVREILKLEYGKPLGDADRKADGIFPVYGANGEKARSNKYFYDKKSIIVGRKGSAGELNLTEEKFWPLDVCYFVTFDEKEYDLMFLYHLLSRLDLPKLARGVKPGINRNEVYSITVNVPSLPEQRRIVTQLQELKIETQRLESLYQRKIAALDELKKSLLHQAFSGAL